MKKRITLFITASLLIAGVTFAFKPDAKQTNTTNQPTTTEQTPTLTESKSETTTETIPATPNPVVPKTTVTNSQTTENTTQPVQSTIQPEPTIAPEQVKITVVSFNQVSISGTENIDCHIIYSDNTDHTWNWKIVTENQGEKRTFTKGACDQSIVGGQKWDNEVGYIIN